MVADIKPDLPTLIVVGARRVADETAAALRSGGVGDVRPSHGFVFAALRSGGRTVGELAGHLEVTHQAAGKLVAELESLGYVRRRPDGADARRRLVTLTPRARDVMEAGRRARAGIVDRLRDAVGQDDLDAAVRVLAALIGGDAASADALGPRARPVA